MKPPVPKPDPLAPKGDIGTYYNANKALLGVPVAPEKAIASPKGSSQDFTNGRVYWSSKSKGAHLVTNPIRKEWQPQFSSVGYPVAEARCDLMDQGCLQKFEKATVYYSPSTTARTVLYGTEIQKTWAGQHSERGVFGYPLSNQVKDSKGKTSQKFQGGVISVENGKVSISYVNAGTSKGIKVASYNVDCSSCAPIHWDDPRRGPAIIKSIRKQAPDVLGLQEAAEASLTDPITKKPTDRAQFEDVAEKLRTAGYKMTNLKRYNCVDDRTAKNCIYKDQQASRGTRIVYNSHATQLIKAGGIALPFDLVSPSPRYASWGIFKHKASGKTYFLMNTHLVVRGSFELHTAQMNAVLGEIAKQNTSHLPVLITGDFNSSNYRESTTNPVSDLAAAAGYRDLLGHVFHSHKTSANTPVKRINAEYHTFNGFNPVTAVRPEGQLGSCLDYIYGSKEVKVKEWETVVDIKSPGVLASTPSDHNMIRTTVTL